LLSRKTKALFKKITLSLIILLTVIGIAIAVVPSLFTKSLDRSLLPMPLSYVVSDGDFILTESTSIYVKGKTDEETDEIYKIAEYLTSKIKPSTGFALNIIKADSVPLGNIYLTTIGGEESQGNEGYQITTTLEGVKLVGFKPEGLSRGIQTLRQLLPVSVEKDTLVTDVKWNIPVSVINDKPEYAYRGIMIDVARHFFSVDDIKRQIDNAVQYKINKIHLHLSDDQGWRLEIKKFPDLAIIGGSSAVDGDAGGYYTQEDFKEIVKYANERYVEIIPEIEMPGHVNAALASYGFLNKSGEKESLYTGIEVGFSTLMCRDEKTYEFIEDIIKEVSEISPSKYIHIGGDESHSTSKEDYDYFMQRACKIVEKYGKTPIGWDPIDTVPEIGDNVVLQNWKDSNAAAQEKKMQMIISIAGKAYLDMKYDSSTPYGLSWAGDISIEDAYNWDATYFAPKELVLGIEAPMFSERITNSKAMDYMIYPRLLGYAEIGWTPKELRNWKEYKIRLEAQGKRMTYQGIEFFSDKKIW